ncbi:hypothetical protein [Anabaena sp. CCY 9402-a]|uniref:hypothetical protein n=1 Tax=Anabaena sp. CCY 9402-a TaxID=3103867 RepID=UPI0039C6DC50
MLLAVARRLAGAKTRYIAFLQDGVSDRLRSFHPVSIDIAIAMTLTTKQWMNSSDPMLP